MIKLRKASFLEHPVLGDLSIDFTDLNNKAVDTIIIAGENGVGKSTLLNTLFTFASRHAPISQSEKYELDIDGGVYTYEIKKISETSYESFWKPNRQINQDLIKGIYSKVDINFNSKPIQSVTSKNIDQIKHSITSGEDLPNEINQLIIDLQSLDDSELATAYREAMQTGKNIDNLSTDNRMKRFKQAFKNIFDDMEYYGIENINNRKEIIFKKYGKKIAIDKLSSGEKQIVYRGAFLLKDCNSLLGAFVFIDEPEISLHPEWQKKIMNYYCDIFRNNAGQQTSQIFTVTHSPFIIHNENRKNDKVIVLSRNSETGRIEIKDKPEYYTWNSPVVIEDAFNIKDFNPDKGTVYLEGRTDEKYFNRAVEIFHYENLPFDFKWIGYLDENGQERNTGKDALKRAYEFLISQNSTQKYVCLADCDTNRNDLEKNNVFQRTIQKYENSKKMKKGIENALVLDNIDTTPFYIEKTKEGDYGDDALLKDFNKMKFCNYICGLDDITLKNVFRNIKLEIDKLIKIYEKSLD